jgi:hypothetical protein
VVLTADHSFYGTKAIRRYGWDLVELVPMTGGKLWEAEDSPRKIRKAIRQMIAALESQGLVEVQAPNAHRNHFHAVKAICSSCRISAQTGYFEQDIQ